MLKVEKEKVPYSIHKFGNTSSASVPLTIVSELQEEIRTKKVKFLLSAFGIGLSWGTVLLETDGIVCPGVLESEGRIRILQFTVYSITIYNLGS